MAHVNSRFYNSPAAATTAPDPMALLTTVRFHTTVAQQQQLPRDGPAEVAFIGRSNAGKSSAINAICQRRRLAFSSRTPGRTQALNYFALGKEPETVGFLVDTPGYGYASAPGAIRQGWDALAGRYLRSRAQLRAVVMMLDIRRGVTDLDRQMLAWIPPGMQVIALLTKADKLGRVQQSAVRRAVRDELSTLRAAGSVEVVLFSSTDRIGIDEARGAIEALFAADDAEVVQGAALPLGSSLPLGPSLLEGDIPPEGGIPPDGAALPTGDASPGRATATDRPSPTIARARRGVRTPASADTRASKKRPR